MPLNIKPCKQECNAQFNSGNPGIKLARRGKCKLACNVKLTEAEHDSILNAHQDKEGMIVIEDLKNDMKEKAVAKCNARNTSTLWPNEGQRNKSKEACKKIEFE